MPASYDKPTTTIDVLLINACRNGKACPARLASNRRASLAHVRLGPHKFGIYLGGHVGHVVSNDSAELTTCVIDYMCDKFLE
jgi:hypothetical protein